MRDEKLYPNASSFDPERFMAKKNSTEKGNEKIVDPRNYVFGFGRRYVLRPTSTTSVD